MDEFNHVIQSQLASLTTAQREIFLTEVSSIRKLQLVIRNIFGLVNELTILESRNFKELCEEFLSMEMVLTRYGILNAMPAADEEFFKLVRMRGGPLGLLMSSDVGYPLRFFFNEDDKNASLNIPVRSGLKLQMTIQTIHLIISRLLDMASTMLECFLHPNSVRAAWDDSPLNLSCITFEMGQRLVFEDCIPFSELKLLSSQLNPDVDPGLTLSLKYKIIKSSGSMGFKVKADSVISSDFNSHLLAVDPVSGSDSQSPSSSKKMFIMTKRRKRVFNFVLWNGKGAMHHLFGTGVRELIDRYNPSLLVISNTKLSHSHAAQYRPVIQSLPFTDHYIFDEYMGHGGALILWNSADVQVSCWYANAVKCFVQVSFPSMKTSLTSNGRSS